MGRKKQGKNNHIFKPFKFVLVDAIQMQDAGILLVVPSELYKKSYKGYNTVIVRRYHGQEIPRICTV